MSFSARRHDVMNVSPDCSRRVSVGQLTAKSLGPDNTRKDRLGQTVLEKQRTDLCVYCERVRFISENVRIDRDAVIAKIFDPARSIIFENNTGD